MPAVPASAPALPSFTARAAFRRLLIPAALAVVALAVVLVAGRRVEPLTRALGHAVALEPGWGALAVVLEGVSLAGYIAVLWMAAGRATPRVGIRESAQITLAGTAATRLLPTAGAGGIALLLWSLRRAGVPARAATRTMFGFLVILYSVFLASIVACGGALALGLVNGPVALGAVPAGLALVAIGLGLGLARLPAVEPHRASSRLRRGAEALSGAIGDALALVRTADPRLLGAAAYWLLDAAALWTILRAFGASPSLPEIGLAYFIGQVANTLPIPGSTTGGLTGMLIALGTPAGPALTAVLAYRAIATWLPVPFGVAALGGLRSTVARWSEADRGAQGAASSSRSASRSGCESAIRCPPGRASGSTPRRSLATAR